jgi:phosphopantetheinyl transferase (holo-ACP synthase)
MGEQQVRSDIELSGPDGRLWMRLDAWQDKRVEVPVHIQQMILWPREGEASWSEPAAGLIQPQLLQCRRVSGASADDQSFWNLVWAHLLLDRQEREQFHRLRVPAKQQLSWLAERAAAKEAVRQLLRARYGRDLLPADIAISLEGQSRPVVSGAVSSTLPAVPLVAVASSGDDAVALAAVPEVASYVGIQMAHLGAFAGATGETVYTDAELRVLDCLLAGERAEWLVRGRCAKEALARALGAAGGAAPQTVTLTTVDATLNLIALQVHGTLAATHPDLAGAAIAVHVSRVGDLVVATTLCQRVTDEQCLVSPPGH